MTDIKQPAKTQFEHSFSDDAPDSREMVEIITEALLSRKGKEITVLDVSELTTLTDYFVVCHGTSDVQIKALADAVEEDLQKKMGEKAWKKEGLQGRSWVILDFVNIVVHVMSKEKRDFYGIERMWNDADVTYIKDSDDEA
ncbi:MAG: ribosome silencing factor [Gracilimonas sp.]|uniref:ribosome silencing factor n=1 Tax=Gracilimonas sp. TaxID=1974203 RepID=UPI0019C2D62C|nr:ribosome silencing factor [Gracilimonas sp.]MBD3617606.1 ribosome silencing factor [Gracilimonas sp.]